MTGITPLETSLVGYWAFDEGAGSVVHDRSIHANDGMLIGIPTWVRQFNKEFGFVFVNDLTGLREYLTA